MDMLVIFAFLMAYFIPSIIAIQRRHRNHTPIFLSNLLFGWTGLGWVITLIWSTTDNIAVAK